MSDIAAVVARIHELAAEDYAAETIASVVVAQADSPTLKALAHSWVLSAAQDAERARAREIERAEAERIRTQAQAQERGAELEVKYGIAPKRHANAGKKHCLDGQWREFESGTAEALRMYLGDSPTIEQLYELDSGKLPKSVTGTSGSGGWCIPGRTDVLQEKASAMPRPEDEVQQLMWDSVVNRDPNHAKISSLRLRRQMEAAIAAAVEERGYGAAMRFTKAFLDTEFALGDGRRVTWRTAKVSDHDTRIEMMQGKAAGLLEDVILHEQVKRTLIEAGVECLGDLPQEEAA